MPLFLQGFYHITKLGWCGPLSSGGILFKYPSGEDSYHSEYSRVRLDKPVPIKSGSQSGLYSPTQSVAKYLSPKGSTNHLYILKLVWKILDDIKVPLFFVEGEKKSMKFVQEGYMAIGLAGIYGAYSKGNLLDEFNLINLRGREVYLLFDGDKFINGSVRKAEQKLAKDLYERTT